MRAAERFARGDKTADIAADERIGLRQAEKWRSAWRHGGIQAVRSTGPHTRERLTDEQFARLETALAQGPLAHGFADQRWTLARIKTLIGRMFHLSYTAPGVWYLLRRHGGRCLVPARRALERDDQTVQVGKKEVWPQVEAPRRRLGPGFASKTKQAGR
jgi:transposase